ncbi:hypothetical protein EMCRGX_G033917 [Ephydatia muelleri]
MDANGTGKETPAGELNLNNESSHVGVLQFFSKEHSSEAFDIIQQMRRDGKLCDVILEVDGKTLPAHRLVLASSSRYFYSMFAGDMCETRQNVVRLNDVEYLAMKLLVEFAYTSRLEITVSNVQSLLTAASLFDFPTVRDACGKFLATQLHPSNCLGIRSFARTHGCGQLLEKASSYFREHFTDAVKSEEFQGISGDELVSLVDSDDVNVRSEEDVFRAVLTWLDHSPESRKEHLPSLLRAVRLPLLSPSFLTAEVEPNQYIRKSLDCRDLLDEAKNFHLMPEQYWHNPRTCFQPRKSTVGVLFAIGGRGAVGEPFNSVECFDFLTNTWSEGPELKSRRRHVGVACLGGRLYAVGGHDGNQHLNSVECYDPKVGKWEYVQPMKTLRRGIAVGVLGGPMYAVGGLDDVNCYRTVERYDPESNEWVEISPLRTSRGGVGVATLGGYLYACGGNDGSTSLQTMERYDPHTNKWTEVTPMTKRRAGVGLAALNGYLYAVGGFDDASPLDSVERYDPQTNVWTEVQPMQVCRGGVGLTSLGGYMFAVGGHDGKSYLSTAEMYSPATNTWKMVAPMKTCRAGAGVVSCPLLLSNIRSISDASESLDSL